MATTSTTAYTPAGTYNDATVSASDKALIAAAQQQWNAANKAGDQTGMNAAHAAAEAVRSKYSYSGGADGSEYIPLSSGSKSYTPQAYYASAPAQYSGAQIATASSASKYINDLYAAQEEANLKALRAAYDSNVLVLNAAGEKIPTYYQDSRNQTAAQSEVQRSNFNEYAAGRGLNSGAGSQAYLTMGNALQSNLSGISRAEADSLSGLDLQRAQLETMYKNDVAQAVADGNLAKAQLLYNDYVRVDDSLVSASKAQADENYRTWSANYSAGQSYNDAMLKYAQLLASYGDFSGYAALGATPAQIANMEEQYAIDTNWYK